MPVACAWLGSGFTPTDLVVPEHDTCVLQWPGQHESSHHEDGAGPLDAGRGYCPQPTLLERGDGILVPGETFAPA